MRNKSTRITIKILKQKHNAGDSGPTTFKNVINKGIVNKSWIEQRAILTFN
jgi:hypothetical protein